MAFALKGTGSASTANSVTADQASLVVTTATTAGAAGDLAILLYAVDNNQTTDGDENAVTSVVDSAGNQWLKAVEFTNGQAGAQAGAVCGLWFCNLRTGIPVGGTVTLTFNNVTSRDASAASLTYFTKAAGFNAELAGVPGTLANDAVAAGSLNSTTANIACLRVRGIASESSTVTALTPTASFAIVTQAVAVIAAATSQGIRGEWIINTGTGTASAPTAGAGAVDNASVYAAFLEVPIGIPPPLSEPKMVARVTALSTVIKSSSGQFSPVIQPIWLNWFAPLSEPVRKVREPHKVNLSPFTAVTIVAATVAIDWFVPLSVPIRVRTSPANQQVLAFAPTPIVAISWSVPLSQPVRAKQRAIADYAYAPLAVSEVVTVDKWFNPLAPPLRSKTLPTATQQATTLAPNPVAVPPLAWFKPLVDPARKIPAAHKVNLSPFTAVAAAEIVTVDKWFAPLVDPVRRKVTLRVNIFPAVAASALSLGDLWWFTPLSEPTRRIAAAQKVNLGHFTAVAAVQTTVDIGWFAPLAGPVRKVPTAQKSYPIRFTAAASAETVTVDKWFAPLADPVRVKLGLATANQQSLAFVKAAPFPEAVTEDRWHQPWSNPLRSKPGLSAANQAAFFAPSTVITAQVVTIGWFNSLSDPTRRKIDVGYLQDYADWIAISVTIDWFGPFSIPTRVRPTATRYEQPSWSLFVEPGAVSFGWYRELALPVRTKPRVAWLTPFSFAPSPIIPSYGWYASLTLPVRIKPKVWEGHYTFAPNPIIPSYGWFGSLSLPVRIKPKVWEGIYEARPPLSIATVHLATMAATEDQDFFLAVLVAFNPPLRAYVDIIQKDPRHRGNVGVIAPTPQSSTIASIVTPQTVPSTGTPVAAVGARVAIITSR